MKKEAGKNRAERHYNVVPLQPYDNTSRAYKAEPRKDTSQARFGMALSLVMVVALILFFFFVYEAVISGYARFK